MPTVSQYGAEAFLSSGGSLQPGVNVLVLNMDGTNAAVYTDITGSTGGTGSPYNPVLTDARGNLTFYAVPAQYQLSLGGIVFCTVVVAPPGSLSATVSSLQASYSTLSSQISALQTQINSAAQGTLTGGYALLTSNSVSVGNSFTAVTGLSIVINPATAGRRVRFTADLNLEMTGGTGTGRVGIFAPGFVVQATACALFFVANGFQHVHLDFIYPNIPTGSQQWVVGIEADSNLVNVVATTSLPAFILAEDIGV